MATTFNSTTVAPFGAITIHRVISALSDVVEAVKAWNRQRNTINALRILSNAQLDDIGLTRADVSEFGRRDL